METKNFINTLKNLHESISQLVEVAKEKQKALVDNDHELMESISTKEQKLLIKIDECERQRTDEMMNLGQMLNIKSKVNLTDLIRKLSENVNREVLVELINLRNDIKEDSTELKRINEQNKALIENSRVYIKEVMKLIRGEEKSFLINKRI